MSTATPSEKEESLSFHLINPGVKARVHLQCGSEEKTLNQAIAPLVIEDVQQLLLKFMVNNISSSNSLRWAVVENEKISRMVLLIVDALSKDDIVRNLSQFQNTLVIFPDMVEVATPLSYNLSFATALCSGYSILGYPYIENDPSIGALTAHASLLNIVPNSKPPDRDINSLGFLCKNFSKLHLLLNVKQLTAEKYPLPQSLLPDPKTRNYLFTQTAYSHVTAESPMFALDCEMCHMKSGRMAVTRIAVVDEKLDVIYETLVKPDGPVANYLKKYSGVDKKMLEPITTRLSDVQLNIQRILPHDAILCGQSLNCDLHALNLIHPYIIDTSVIFNMSGCRYQKSSLQKLSLAFLNMVIQNDAKGHNPIEDCIATMKLVQLKLEKGLVFGDAILTNAAKLNKLKDKSVKSIIKCDIKPSPTAETEELNVIEDLSNINFFPKLQSKGKRAFLVTDTVSYPNYPQELTDCVDRVSKPDMKEAVEQSIELMNKYDLTVCHVNIEMNNENNGNTFISLDKHIQKLYAACTCKKSLFLVAATGTVQSYNCYENAILMIRGENV